MAHVKNMGLFTWQKCTKNNGGLYPFDNNCLKIEFLAMSKQTTFILKKLKIRKCV